MADAVAAGSSVYPTSGQLLGNSLPVVQRDAAQPNDSAAHTLANGPVAPAAVNKTLGNKGKPLDAQIGRTMGRRLGHDFSRVRVHDDSQAHASAQEIAARAYTVGNDVVFAAGQYSPQSQEGRQLLAHELVHVVQQSRMKGEPRILQRVPWGKCPPGRRLDARRSFIHAPAELFAVGYYYAQFPGHCILTNEMLAMGEIPVCKEPEATMVDKLMRHFHRDKRPMRRRAVRPTEEVTERAESAGTALTGAVELVQTLLQPDILDVTSQQVYDITTKKQRSAKKRKIKDIYVPRLDMVTGGHWAAGHTLPAPKGFGLQFRVSTNTVLCYGATDFARWPGVIQYEPIDTSKKSKKKKSKKKDGKKGGKKSSAKKPSAKKPPAKKPPVKKPPAKAPSKPNPTNKGLGIGIMSTTEGGANVGVGVSIMSGGVAVGTAGVGVSVGSTSMAAGTASGGVSIGDTGEAVGAVGVGASKSSTTSAAAAAGAGVSKESKSEALATAGAGVSEESEAKATAAASAGKMKKSRGTAKATAGTGETEDVTAEAAPPAPGEAEAEGAPKAATETEGAAGKEAGTAAKPGTKPGAETGTGAGEGEKPGAAGKEGEAAGTKAAAGEAKAAAGGAGGGKDVPIDFSGVKATDVKKAIEEGEKIRKLLEGASPAQIELMKKLAEDSENGVYMVPAADWVETMMKATEGLSPEDLAYVMGLDWVPGHMSPEELRKAVEEAVKRKDEPKGEKSDATDDDKTNKGEGTAGKGGDAAAKKAGKEGGGAGEGTTSGAKIESGVARAETPPAELDRTPKGDFPFRILSGLERNGSYTSGASYPCTVQITDGGRTFKVAGVEITYVDKEIRRESRGKKNYDIVYFKLHFTADFWVPKHKFYGLGGPDTTIDYDFGGPEVR